jgi:hypothetical protein
VYNSSPSLTTVIAVLPGSVSATTVLSYTAVPTATAPAGFGFGGLAFTLDAYRNGVRQDGFAFTQSIAVSVLYGDGDVVGLDEQTLKLDYWNGTSWVDAATTCTPPSTYTHRPETNAFAVLICHLSEFGVFGVPQHKVLLPLMRR